MADLEICEKACPRTQLISWNVLTSRDGGELWLRGHGRWESTLGGDSDSTVGESWHASDHAEAVGLGQEVGHGVGVGESARDGGATGDLWDDLRCLSVDPCIEGNSWSREMTHRRGLRRLRVGSGHEWRDSDDGVAHVDYCRCLDGGLERWCCIIMVME